MKYYPDHDRLPQNLLCLERERRPGIFIFTQNSRAHAFANIVANDFLFEYIGEAYSQV